MKNLVLASVIAFTPIFSMLSQNKIDTTQTKFEIKIITSVESIVPIDLGRSCLISANVDRDYKAFSTKQTEYDNKRNKS